MKVYYSYDAWSTVVAELKEKRGQLDGVLDAGKVMRLSDLIYALEREWNEEKGDDR